MFQKRVTWTGWVEKDEVCSPKVPSYRNFLLTKPLGVKKKIKRFIPGTSLLMKYRSTSKVFYSCFNFFFRFLFYYPRFISC